MTSTVVPGLGAIACTSTEKGNTNNHVDQFKKIDIHTHISTDAFYLREIMDSLNLKMFTICNAGLKPDRLIAQVDAAVEISREYPRYYGWCTTFKLDGIFEPGWVDDVINDLKRDFDNGALAVKVWKEIGMQLKTPDGKFVQIDDPVFDPIFEFIEKEGKTLFAHIGDPVGQWLSVGDDGKLDGWYIDGRGVVRNRIGKFYGDVPYHMLIKARDRMVEKRPGLKVVACHMGCMAFDVNEIAERLDKYPNLAVETSYSLRELMDQSREKARSFFTQYQDRIIYGSDISGGMVPTHFLVDMTKLGSEWTPEEVKKEKEKLLEQYHYELSYFSTDLDIQRDGFTIKGLALPDEILSKILYDNAVKWIPGVDAGF